MKGHSKHGDDDGKRCSTKRFALEVDQRQTSEGDVIRHRKIRRALPA